MGVLGEGLGREFRNFAKPVAVTLISKVNDQKMVPPVTATLTKM